MVEDSTGHKYVAFDDGSVGGKLSVMDYNAGAWDYYPDLPRGRGISLGGAWQISMIVDATDVPSVAVADGGTGNKASEFYYDGAAWVNRGLPGFTSGLVPPTSVWYLHSAVSPSGEQYVAFSDNTAGNAVTVMKFNAGTSAWELVGPRAFYGSGPGVSDTGIAIDSKGTPYVAFCDIALGNRVTVMKFDGTLWQTVGRPGFTVGSGDYLCFAIGPDDTPYVAFSDPSLGGHVTVLAYR
jgi:hypothetical protein